MKRTLIALSTAAVLGTASIAAPSPAQAHAWWVVPVIVGGVLVAGAAAASANPYYGQGYYGPSYYGPGPGPAYYRGNVAVAPTTVQRTRSCRVVRERVAGGWNRYQVCR